MASEAFSNALHYASELNLTVTGRKSARESTRPVWFVRDGDRLLLLPGGSRSDWYRNVLVNPEVRLAVDGEELTATAMPIEDPAAVAEVVERFGRKYGVQQIRDFYPQHDVAVEVRLG